MKGRLTPLCKQQHGVYALEWAIVFPVFFMLLYAFVSYGLTFLVRQSMQSAVEDGARAALQYQVLRVDRINAASRVTSDRLSWLPQALQPVIDVSVCRIEAAMPCAPTLSCGNAWEKRCLVRVSASIPYGSSPLAPPIPGLGVFVPAALTASASVLVASEGF